ncbi:xylanase A [Rhypophila decipiens]|uniref:Xylanase A n=1 Tax=Rhypophila decipiens TaxID=261697 RepID=A0AAN6Y6E4_9PEZI|nr:xylanase A [Rhypophila decipiens]
MRANTCSLLWLTAIFGQHAAAADVFVSPGGADNNAGTSDKPLKSLPAAQKALRDLLARSPNENITVNLAPGVYPLSAPLVLTEKDSGNNGASVNWVGPGAVISGGIEVTGWTVESNGIYSAKVPVGVKSRNLYVNGKAANLARRKVNRGDLRYTSTSITWSNSGLDWLSSTKGIDKAEMRWISSFTDRYSPIQSVKNRELVMKQNSWFHNNWGYDHISKPNADFGVWVQNALALLVEGGQFFLDSAAGKVYYKPLAGENIATSKAYLGVLEALVTVGGTSYGSPAQNIYFKDISFAHTTWNQVTDIGYIDQQTGGNICETNRNYDRSNFESARPWWCQMLSAVQVSAAKNIGFSGGNYTQLGAGGIGIGNDPNAHLSGVGLGASRVAVRDAYFTQIMGNSITAGGIRPDAHHPPDNRMINQYIDITGNIFYNVSVLYSSTVPIFAAYVQYSTITNNDIDYTPYSGICLGYGWGSNDAGGSQEYVNRGLYKYQTKYTTPTISRNNLIQGNLAHRYGYGHTDLGAYYTLSKSPDTYLTDNYAYDASGFGTYTDEGSNSYIIANNVLLPSGQWSAQNGVNTANNTYKDNYYRTGINRPGNFQISNLSQASVNAKRVAYRAGILPGKRAGRPVSNQPVSALPDGVVTVILTRDSLSITVDNFDDKEFTNVTFEARVTNNSFQIGSDIGTVPKTVPANGKATGSWKVNGNGANSGKVTATVKYVNSRTGESGTLTGGN